MVLYLVIEEKKWQLCFFKPSVLLFRMGNKNHPSRQLRTHTVLFYSTLISVTRLWQIALFRARRGASRHLENVCTVGTYLCVRCALSGSSLRIMLVMIMAFVYYLSNNLVQGRNIDITQEFALQVLLEISSRPFWVSYITVTAKQFFTLFSLCNA